MTNILFEIPGEPVAQGRPRAGKTWTGNTVLYDPAKSRDFKQYVKLVASQHAPKELITGPIDLAIDIIGQLLKSIRRSQNRRLSRRVSYDRLLSQMSIIT